GERGDHLNGVDLIQGRQFSRGHGAGDRDAALLLVDGDARVVLGRQAGDNGQQQARGREGAVPGGAHAIFSRSGEGGGSAVGAVLLTEGGNVLSGAAVPFATTFSGRNRGVEVSGKLLDSARGRAGCVSAGSCSRR